MPRVPKYCKVVFLEATESLGVGSGGRFQGSVCSIDKARPRLRCIKLCTMNWLSALLILAAYAACTVISHPRNTCIISLAMSEYETKVQMFRDHSMSKAHRVQCFGLGNYLHNTAA